jgi:hypothetical protein
MDLSKYTLYSSGLKGAEATFGEIAEKTGIKDVVYSFDGHKLSRENNVIILKKEQLERGDISIACSTAPIMKQIKFEKYCKPFFIWSTAVIRFL